MCLLGSADPDASWLHSSVLRNALQFPVEGALQGGKHYLVLVLGGSQIAGTLGSYLGVVGGVEDFCWRSPAWHPC